MSDKKVFVEGMYFNRPREGAPEFVKGSISIELKKFFEWCKIHQDEGKVRIDLLVSKNDKDYAALNTWKPEKKAEPASGGWDSNSGDGSDGIPFAPMFDKF